MPAELSTVMAIGTTTRPEQDSALELEALYEQHALAVCRLLQRLTGPGPHVDDLLQEVFIVAWRRLGEIDPKRGALSWLYGIAANLARRYRRGLFRFLRAKERLSSEPVLASHDPGEAIERAERRSEVHAALRELPFKQREVFVLYELEGLEGPAIADVLGIPIGTVWTRLHHARRRFTSIMLEQDRRERE